MVRLVEIEPCYVRSYENLILPGLEVVRSYSPEPWRIADVFTSLEWKNSKLLLVYRQNEYVGFFVVNEQSIGGKKGIAVWACWMGDGLLLEVIDGPFEQWVIGNGYSFVRFSSSRAGWRKKLANRGYAPVSAVYERKIGVSSGRNS